MTLVADIAELEHTHVVLRSFTAEGREVARGEVVNTSAWRSVTPLIRARRLAHILTPEARDALPEDFHMPTVTFGEQPPEKRKYTRKLKDEDS